MQVWSHVHPMHVKNTWIAQNELDMEALDYHNEEWKDKNRQAEIRVMRKLARDNPYFFVRGYILDREEGSDERKVLVEILKKFNPEYYSECQDVLGEGMDWDEEMSEMLRSSDTDIDDLETDEYETMGDS